MIGVTPMPAEISTIGCFESSTTRSPNGAETLISLPSKWLWCRKFDTSPAGTAVPSPAGWGGTALTEMLH